MAKTWVLDTETKGTGAHIAPLTRDSGRESEELSLVRFHPTPAPGTEEHATPRPALFKVVDVFSAGVLAEDVGAADAARALTGLRTAMDARVYIREADGGRWRLLSLSDTKALWTLAQRAAPTEDPGGG
jgi:hypothetical protein